MDQPLILVLIGIFVGAYGTLVGAGGGSILMPILLLLQPDAKADYVTSVSLAVVFFNSLSGIVAYVRLKRIDYRSGLLFVAAAVPGAAIGALISPYIPRAVFNAIFGMLMIGLSGFLVTHPPQKSVQPKSVSGGGRKIVDSDGRSYWIAFNPKLGFAVSFCISCIASLLGIGGGVIYVPMLIHVLNFPVHLATATSIFTQGTLSLTASVVHLAHGTLLHGVHQIVPISIGVMIGAPLGARLSSYMKGKTIVRALSVILGIVGVRILYSAFCP